MSTRRAGESNEGRTAVAGGDKEVNDLPGEWPICV